MRRLITSLLFLLGAVLLGGMIWAADPHRLWESITAMPGTITGCLLVWMVGYGFNTASWGTLLSRPHLRAIGWWRLYRITVAGYAINYLTPFGLLGGEPYRVVALRPQVEPQTAATSVLLYLTMHVLSHVVLWLSTCLLALWLVPRFAAHLVPSLLTVVGVLAAIGLLLLLLRLIPACRRYIDHFGSEARHLLREEPRRFCRSLLLEYLSRLWNCLEYLLILRAIGLDMGYFDALMIVAFSSLFANLLFFSPLQMGTREGGILLAMQLLLPDMTSEALLPLAVTVSIVTRIREFAWIAIGLVFTKK